MMNEAPLYSQLLERLHRILGIARQIRPLQAQLADTDQKLSISKALGRNLENRLRDLTEAISRIAVAEKASVRQQTIFVDATMLSSQQLDAVLGESGDIITDGHCRLVFLIFDPAARKAVEARLRQTQRDFVCEQIPVGRPCEQDNQEEKAIAILRHFYRPYAIVTANKLRDVAEYDRLLSSDWKLVQNILECKEIKPGR